MKSRFSMNGPPMHFDRIDLLTEGRELRSRSATSSSTSGRSRPTRSNPRSTSRRRRRSSSKATGSPPPGNADFDGTFHYFKGGREVKGTWRTPVTHVKIGANTWRFPNLQRRRAVAAGPARGHRREQRVVRRHGAISITASCRSTEVRARARDLGRRITTTSISRSSPTSSRPVGCGWPVRQPGATASNGRSADGIFSAAEES